MAHHHINRNLLSAALEGEIRAPELILRLMLHLEEICPTCEEGIDEFVKEREASAFDELDDLLSPRLLAAVKAAEQQREQLRSVAQRELDELLELAPEDRMRRVARARKRFRSPYLVDRLLQHSHDRRAFDPSEALEIADLAMAVAVRIPASEFGGSLAREQVVRALVFRANALRAGGHLREADEILAKPLAAMEDLPDPLLQAEILSLAASLRKDQRRLSDAARLLGEAAALYRELGEVDQLGMVLIQAASVAYYQGDPERAVEILCEIEGLLEPDEDSRLALYVRHNMAVYLCETDQPKQAGDVLEASRSLYRRFPDPWVQLRLRWLEGKVAWGMGETEGVESKLLEAREGFVQGDFGYDAAMVSLDLALLYAKQGRTTDMKRLAEEMLPVFHSQEIHREAIAAFLIFRRAAQAEAVTVRMIQDLAIYLRQQWGSPPLHHELPS